MAFNTKRAPVDRKKWLDTIQCVIVFVAVKRLMFFFCLRSKECRICNVAMGVTRANVSSMTYGKGDLLCPLGMEWRAKRAHAIARCTACML